MNKVLEITKLILDFILGAIEITQRDSLPKEEKLILKNEQALKQHEETVKENLNKPKVKIEEISKLVDQKQEIEKETDLKVVTFLEMKYAESEKEILNRKISKYFTLKEALRYDNGRKTIPLSYLTNKEDTFNRILKHAKALDTIRERFGKPMLISSWLRTPEWNKKVGGVSNSRHLFGDAADCVIVGFTPKQVYSTISPGWVGGVGSYKTFTHIDTRGTVARWVG